MLLAIRVMTLCSLWKILLYTSERMKVKKANIILVSL